MKTILGLDVSLTATGLCVTDAEASRFEILDLQTLKTKPGVRVQERYHSILTRMEEAGVEKSELVGIEDYAFMASGRGFTSLCELQGILRYRMWKIQQGGAGTFGEYITISPSTIKKLVSGKGNTKKNLIPMFVKDKYMEAILRSGIEIKDDNQADSIGIAHLTWLYYRFHHGLEIMGGPLNKDLQKTLKELKVRHEEACCIKV